MTYDTLAEFEQEGRSTMGSPDFQAWYQKFTPHVESGYREIFTVVD